MNIIQEILIQDGLSVGYVWKNLMQDALKLCSLALSSNPTTSTASLVKVDQGMMSAYGGLFCIQVPVSQEIGAAFNPRALSNFFRKERKRPAYTVKFPKLTISEGREKLTISCLAPEELAIIDNIETPVPCTLDLKMLKLAAELCNKEDEPLFAQGVTFRDGSMMSTNNKVFLCGESGLPDDQSFVVHREACLALTKFDRTVVALSRNSHTVKFIFEDGSSLCSHIMLDAIPDISQLFEGEWQDFKITADLKDFLKLDCDDIHVGNGNITFLTDTTVGELEGVVEGTVNFKAKKKHFNYLLDGEISFEGRRLQSVGENWVIICSCLA